MSGVRIASPAPVLTIVGSGAFIEHTVCGGFLRCNGRPRQLVVSHPSRSFLCLLTAWPTNRFSRGTGKRTSHRGRSLVFLWWRVQFEGGGSNSCHPASCHRPGRDDRADLCGCFVWRRPSIGSASSRWPRETLRSRLGAWSAIRRRLFRKLPWRLSTRGLGRTTGRRRRQMPGCGG